MKEEIYIDLDGQELNKITKSNGTTYYYNKQGKPHRLDGPAYIDDGYQAWYKDGKLHRLDGPACIWKDGTEFWYKDGKLHRLDGPAWIWADGSEEYWLEGKEVTKKEYYKMIGKSNQDISITKD